MKLIKRITEGEPYDQAYLSWVLTRGKGSSGRYGFLRLVLNISKHRYYIRFRWNPKPFAIFTYMMNMKSSKKKTWEFYFGNPKK